MGRYSDLYLKEQQAKLGQPQVQQPVTVPQDKPVKPAKPVPSRRPQSVVEGVGNVGRAVYNGLEGLVQNVAANPVQFAKDTATGLIVNPAKEIIQHPAASAQSFVGGAVKGTVMLPQNIQNLVADTQDAYMGREGYSKKWNYAPEVTNALQGNPIYEHYKEQKELAPTMNEFGDFLGAGAGIGGVAGGVAKGASKISKSAKLAKETARIADKLSDAQKAKYATQIEKLAAKNVANNIAKENIAKAAASKTVGNQLKQNVTMGAALGALEGDNLEDRVANAAQVATIGGLLTGAHVGGKAALKSRPGRIANIQAKKFIKNASKIPFVSKIIAGLDYAFNTNNAKFANDLTRKRKEFYKQDAVSDELSRHIDEGQHELLEKAGELTPEQQVEIFEHLKNGKKNVEERKTTPKTNEKVQEDINGQVEDKNAKSTIKQDKDKTFEELMEEAPQVIIKRPVKKEVLPEQQAPVEPKVSVEPKAKRFNGQLPQKYYKGGIKDANAEKGRVTQYLEPGKAEGADYSEEAWYSRSKPKPTKNDPYTGKRKPDVEDTKEYEMYKNNIWEDRIVSGRESDLDSKTTNPDMRDAARDIDVSSGVTKYRTASPEMVKFMDAYDKADPKTQKKLLNDKLKSLGSQEEQIKFFEDFKAEQERKTDMNRPHKVGDVEVPTNEAEHIQNVNEAFKNNKHSKSTDFDRDIRIIENQKRRARQKQIEEANKLFDAEGNEMDFDPFPTSKKKDIDYLQKGFEKVNDEWLKRQEEKLGTKYKDNETIKGAVKELSELRKTADSVVPVKTVIKNNTRDYNIFSKEDKKILEDSNFDIVMSREFDQRGGAIYEADTIIVNPNANRKGEIVQTIRHEMQHIIDRKKLEALPENHPINKFRSRWRADYNKAVSELNDITAEFNKVMPELRKTNKSFAKVIDEVHNIPIVNYKNVDKYKRLVNNTFKNDIVLKNLFNRYFDNLSVYHSSPMEIRAYNTQFNIKNKGDIINDTAKFFRERYGFEFRTAEAKFRLNEGDAGKSLADITTTSDVRPNSKIETDYLKRGLDKEVDTANSVAKTTIVKTNNNISTIEDAFTNLSKSREDWFRKYGTYTDERMKNRLFKQSKDGLGIYFQQAAKDDGLIDWGKDKQSQKVGFSGKKVYEGLRQKGTIQAALNRMFQTQVKMSHVDGKIEFLKKNFSEKKDGFIPVNSKLLANAMFFGKSKAWYETLSKGKEAISKTFDEANAKEWRELFDTTDANTKDLYLPKDIYDLCLTGEKELPADYLATYGKEVGSKNWFKAKSKQVAALLDFYNDRFKRKVLTSATFFMNNRFGNQIMLMANSGNPMDYLRGIYDAIKTKDSGIPNEVLESTLAESIKQDSMNMTKRYWSEKDNGIDTLARIINGDRIKIENLKGLDKLKAIGINVAVSYPNLLFRKLSDFSGRVNNSMERFERKQAYSQVISKLKKKGVVQFANKINGTIEIAKLAKDNPVLRQTVLDGVADILGDYNNFSKFERNVMKRIIPFYAWDRTIIRHAIALAKDNPVKLALIGLETYRLLHQDDGLEDYQHGALKTNIKNKRTGSNLVINKGRYIPYNTLFELLDSDERVGAVSPAITKVEEAVKGEKNFLKSEISSKNYKRIQKDGKKGYLNIKTGEFKEGKAPLSVRAGYLAKEGYEFLYPHTRSALTSGYADMAKHYKETGEVLFPDKPYDANLGGLYHGEYAGKAGKYTKTQSAANRLDLPYQLINKYGGVGFQPEHLKERTQKYKNKHKRK